MLFWLQYFCSGDDIVAISATLKEKAKTEIAISRLTQFPRGAFQGKLAMKWTMIKKKHPHNLSAIIIWSSEKELKE